MFNCRGAPLERPTKEVVVNAPNNVPFGNRRSIRLPQHDYASAGFYYLTICSVNKLHLFGKVTSGQVELSAIGEVVDSCWRQIPAIYSHVLLDEYVIMPNHLHGIMVILPRNRMISDTDLTNANLGPGALARILGQFKSVSSKTVLKTVRQGGPLDRPYDYGMSGAPLRRFCDHVAIAQCKRTIWQRNYFEHIIRTEKALLAIRQYIQDNPLKWSMDELNR